MNKMSVITQTNIILSSREGFNIESVQKGSLHLIYFIQISFETTHFLVSFFFKFHSPLSGFFLLGDSGEVPPLAKNIHILPPLPPLSSNSHHQIFISSTKG